MISATLALHRRRQRIERLFAIARNSDPLEQQPPLSQFLCVQASGFIEKSVKDAFAEFALSHCRKEVGEFVGARLRRYRNFNSEQLVQLVRDHSIEWADQFSTFLGDRYRNAIDSIYNNRNQIAHGIDVGIGLVQIRGYYDDAGKVVDYLFTSLLGLTP